MKKNTVCKGCEKPKRHEGCHSTCPEYIAECEEIKKEKEKIYEGKMKEFIINDYKKHSHAKAMKVVRNKKRS